MTANDQSKGLSFAIFRSRSGARFVLYGLIGAFLTILAPFGSGDISPLWWRGSYWFVMIYGGAAISTVVIYFWNVVVKPEQDRIFSLPIAGQILVTAIPITAMVFGLSAGLPIKLNGFDLSILYFYVVTITAAVTIGTQAVDQSFALKSALAQAEEVARTIHAAHKNQEGDVPPAAFAQRLKPDLRQADILSLSADDHYLDVVTSRGREQIRCTVAEAATELAPIDGRVIHRSHWVARSAVDELIRSGNQASVRLSDARELPVSRARLRQLQSENWFPG